MSPVDSPKLRSLAKALLKKGIPPIKGLRDKELCHLVFVPEVTQDAPSEIDGVHVVTGDQVLSEMRRPAGERRVEVTAQRKETLTPSRQSRLVTLGTLKEIMLHLHSNSQNLYRNMRQLRFQLTIASLSVTVMVLAMLVLNEMGFFEALGRHRQERLPMAILSGVLGGEDLQAALRRELREETNILPEHFRVLDACRDWLAYELPEAYRNDKVGRGQAQKWFLCRFQGEPNTIKPDGVEFVSYEWVDRTKLLDRAAPFRRAIYERLVAEFTSHFGRKQV